MIEYKTQLKIQSYLDGELSEREARQLSELLARDRDAAALLQELRQTHQILSVYEPAPLPESRDFYWSKIRREIVRLEAVPLEPAPISVFTALRRLLVPATAVAIVAVVSVIAVLQSDTEVRIAAETAVTDSDSFTYHDFSSGTTLVWLPYPADNELADNSGAGSID